MGSKGLRLGSRFRSRILTSPYEDINELSPRNVQAMRGPFHGLTTCIQQLDAFPL